MRHMQLNVHAVTGITVVNRQLSEHGSENWPDGLVCTRITLDTDDGPMLIVAFGADSSQKIQLALAEDDD